MPFLVGIALFVVGFALGLFVALALARFGKTAVRPEEAESDETPLRKLAERSGAPKRPQKTQEYVSRIAHRGRSLMVETHWLQEDSEAVRATQIRLFWPDVDFNLQLYPQQQFERLGKARGFADIIIGQPEFDRRWAIHGTDANGVKAILTSDVRKVIETMSALAGEQGLYWSIRSGQMVVRLFASFDEAGLQKFADLIVDLFEAAQAASVSGVRVIESDDPPPLGEAVCGVCGEKCVGDVVLCRRCRTPHHRECWHYSGQCSVYACPETRFVNLPDAKLTKRA